MLPLATLRSHRMKSFSIRTRLYLINLACLGPALALIVYTFHDDQERAVVAARAEALRLAHLAALHQEQTIQGTRQLLIILSQLPVVLQCDGAACQGVFQALLPRFRGYLNLGLIAPDGTLAASALPPSGTVDLGDRGYFQEVVRTREFTVGEYQVGRVTGRPGLNFGYPVLDPAGQLKGVVFAALDLAWTEKVAAEVRMGEGATLLMVDLRGSVLTRYPDPGRWMGVSVADRPLVSEMLTKREGVLEGPGLDGVERVHGFTSFGPGPSLFVSVGLSRETTLSPARRALANHLWALGVVIVLAFLAAWLGGDALILRRLGAVSTAADRLATGDLQSRARVEGSDEVARLAGVFNAMAERLGAMVQTEQDAKKHLAQQVDDLVRDRTREATLLNEMAQLLQAADDRGEACAIIGRMAPRFFPGRSGALFLTNASRNLVESAVTWGTTPQMPVFAPEDCWALRRGQPHRVEESDGATVCRHVGPSPIPRYCCLPLVAHGETLGVFHLSGEGPRDDATCQMVGAVAEQCALALANLRLRETLRNQSIRDPLTGLFNRRYLEETLEREVRRSARSGKSVGVLLFDIDHFKTFNDGFGHEAGDAVLREFGSLLLRSTRGGDVAGRLGGEEFVVLLPETGLEDAKRRADQIRQDLERLRVSNRGEALGVVTTSAGVATYPEHGADPEDLLRAADSALYRAKEGGRNRVETA